MTTEQPTIENREPQLYAFVGGAVTMDQVSAIADRFPEGAFARRTLIVIALGAAALLAGTAVTITASGLSCAATLVVLLPRLWPLLRSSALGLWATIGLLVASASAASTSGLPRFTAVEVTTTATPSTFAASWPIVTLMPRARSPSTT